MSDDNDDDDVGYQKPPKHARFKPGQSGNPKGRRRGSKNVRTMVGASLNESIPVTRRGRRVKAPFLEVFLAQIKLEALQGNEQARRHVYNWTKGSGLLNEPAPSNERPVGLIVLPARAIDNKTWYEQNKDRVIEDNEYTHLVYPNGRPRE